MVDFPLPVLPVIATVVPGCIEKLRFFTAVIPVSGYVKLTFLNSKAPPFSVVCSFPETISG